MSDTATMDEVGTDGGEFETTADERKLLGTIRDQKFSAGEVNTRLERATKPKEPAPLAGTEKPMTETRAKELVADGVAINQRQNDAVAAHNEIGARIDTVIDGANIPGIGASRREQMKKDVMKEIQGRKDFEKLTNLSDADFKTVVAEEAGKRMEAEQTYIKEAGQAGRDKSKAENKTAADAVGQTSEAGPPPRSNASTEQRDDGSRVTPDNMKHKFGIGENWGTTESRHLSEQHGTAKKFLADARGGG